LAIALFLLIVTSLSGARSSAQPVEGTDSVGPLTIHIATLRIPEPTGDTLPPGPDLFYIFTIIDTGSTLVGIDTIFDAVTLDFFNPAVPPLLDVRVWGLNDVDPVDLGAPLDDPAAEVEDIGVDTVPVGTPTLIGAPVTNHILAFIDYANTVTRGPYFGDWYATGPTIYFFNPGDPGIPTPPMSADLVPFGSTAPAPNGTSRGQRYYIADMRFENDGNTADSTTFDFLFDTGNTTSQVTEAVALALGIDLVNDLPDDTVCIGGSGPACDGGDLLNGYIVDRMAIRASPGLWEYVINNPLIFVKPPPAFGGAADGNIGTNYFETTQVLFDGPGAQLGLYKRVWAPEPGRLVLMGVGLAVVLIVGRGRIDASRS
jgi:hypothetical protein